MRWLALGFSFFYAGCCDCVANGVRIDTVDASGNPIAVDRLSWALDGEPEGEDVCVEGGDCTGWFVLTPVEGTWTFVAVLDGDGGGDAQRFGTAEVVVAFAKGDPLQCCSDGFHGELEIVVGG